MFYYEKVIWVIKSFRLLADNNYDGFNTLFLVFTKKMLQYLRDYFMTKLTLM